MSFTSINLSQSVLRPVFAGAQAATMLVALMVALRRNAQGDALSLLGSYIEVAAAILPLVAIAALLGLVQQAGVGYANLLVPAGCITDVFAAILIASPKLRTTALYGLILGIISVNVAWAWTIPGPASIVITALMFWIGFRIMWRELRKRRPRTG